MNDDFEKNTEGENEYEPILISVEDENGVEHSFEELDSLEVDGTEYVALIPSYEDEDIIDSDGELIILIRNYDGDEIYLEPIEDEELFMKIGNMFENRLSDMFEFNDEE